MKWRPELVEIKEGKGARIVRAFIVSAPEGRSIDNLQELAQRAWDSPYKQTTVGGVTVRVEKLKR